MDNQPHGSSSDSDKRKTDVAKNKDENKRKSAELVETSSDAKRRKDKHENLADKNITVTTASTNTKSSPHQTNDSANEISNIKGKSHRKTDHQRGSSSPSKSKRKVVGEEQPVASNSESAKRHKSSNRDQEPVTATSGSTKSKHHESTNVSTKSKDKHRESVASTDAVTKNKDRHHRSASSSGRTKSKETKHESIDSNSEASKNKHHRSVASTSGSTKGKETKETSEVVKSKDKHRTVASTSGSSKSKETNRKSSASTSGSTKTKETKHESVASSSESSRTKDKKHGASTSSSTTSKERKHESTSGSSKSKDTKHGASTSGSNRSKEKHHKSVVSTSGSTKSKNRRHGSVASTNENTENKDKHDEQEATTNESNKNEDTHRKSKRGDKDPKLVGNTGNKDENKKSRSSAKTSGRNEDKHSKKSNRNEEPVASTCSANECNEPIASTSGTGKFSSGRNNESVSEESDDSSIEMNTSNTSNDNVLEAYSNNVTSDRLTFNFFKKIVNLLTIRNRMNDYLRMCLEEAQKGNEKYNVDMIERVRKIADNITTEYEKSREIYDDLCNEYNIRSKESIAANPIILGIHNILSNAGGEIAAILSQANISQGNDQSGLQRQPSQSNISEESQAQPQLSNVKTENSSDIPTADFDNQHREDVNPEAHNSGDNSDGNASKQSDSIVTNSDNNNERNVNRYNESDVDYSITDFAKFVRNKYILTFFNGFNNLIPINCSDIFDIETDSLFDQFLEDNLEEHYSGVNNNNNNIQAPTENAFKTNEELFRVLAGLDEIETSENNNNNDAAANSSGCLNSGSTEGDNRSQSDVGEHSIDNARPGPSGSFNFRFIEANFQDSNRPKDNGNPETAPTVASLNNLENSNNTSRNARKPISKERVLEILRILQDCDSVPESCNYGFNESKFKQYKNTFNILRGAYDSLMIMVRMTRNVTSEIDDFDFVNPPENNTLETENQNEIPTEIQSNEEHSELTNPDSDNPLENPTEINSSDDHSVLSISDTIDCNSSDSLNPPENDNMLEKENNSEDPMEIPTEINSNENYRLSNPTTIECHSIVALQNKSEYVTSYFVNSLENNTLKEEDQSDNFEIVTEEQSGLSNLATIDCCSIVPLQDESIYNSSDSVNPPENNNTLEKENHNEIPTEIQSNEEHSGLTNPDSDNPLEIPTEINSNEEHSGLTNPDTIDCNSIEPLEDESKCNTSDSVNPPENNNTLEKENHNEIPTEIKSNDEAPGLSNLATIDCNSVVPLQNNDVIVKIEVIDDENTYTLEEGNPSKDSIAISNNPIKTENTYSVIKYSSTKSSNLENKLNTPIKSPIADPIKINIDESEPINVSNVGNIPPINYTVNTTDINISLNNNPSQCVTELSNIGSNSCNHGQNINCPRESPIAVPTEINNVESCGLRSESINVTSFGNLPPINYTNNSGNTTTVHYISENNNSNKDAIKLPNISLHLSNRGQNINNPRESPIAVPTEINIVENYGLRSEPISVTNFGNLPQINYTENSGNTATAHYTLANNKSSNDAVEFSNIGLNLSNRGQNINSPIERPIAVPTNINNVAISGLHSQPINVTNYGNLPPINYTVNSGNTATAHYTLAHNNSSNDAVEFSNIGLNLSNRGQNINSPRERPIAVPTNINNVEISGLRSESVNVTNFGNLHPINYTVNSGNTTTPHYISAINNSSNDALPNIGLNLSNRGQNISSPRERPIAVPTNINNVEISGLRSEGINVTNFGNLRPINYTINSGNTTTPHYILEINNSSNDALPNIGLNLSNRGQNISSPRERPIAVPTNINNVEISGLRSESVNVTNFGNLHPINYTVNSGNTTTPHYISAINNSSNDALPNIGLNLSNRGQNISSPRERPIAVPTNMNNVEISGLRSEPVNVTNVGNLPPLNNNYNTGNTTIAHYTSASNNPNIRVIESLIFGSNSNNSGKYINNAGKSPIAVPTKINNYEGSGFSSEPINVTNFGNFVPINYIGNNRNTTTAIYTLANNNSNNPAIELTNVGLNLNNRGQYLNNTNTRPITVPARINSNEYYGLRNTTINATSFGSLPPISNTGNITTNNNISTNNNYSTRANELPKMINSNYEQYGFGNSPINLSHVGNHNPNNYTFNNPTNNYTIGNGNINNSTAANNYHLMNSVPNRFAVPVPRNHTALRNTNTNNYPLVNSVGIVPTVPSNYPLANNYTFSRNPATNNYPLINNNYPLQTGNASNSRNIPMNNYPLVNVGNGNAINSPHPLVHNYPLVPTATNYTNTVPSNNTSRNITASNSNNADHYRLMNRNPNIRPIEAQTMTNPNYQQPGPSNAVTISTNSGKLIENNYRLDRGNRRNRPIEIPSAIDPNYYRVAMDNSGNRLQLDINESTKTHAPTNITKSTAANPKHDYRKIRRHSNHLKQSNSTEGASNNEDNTNVNRPLDFSGMHNHHLDRARARAREGGSNRGRPAHYDNAHALRMPTNPNLHHRNVPMGTNYNLGNNVPYANYSHVNAAGNIRPIAHVTEANYGMPVQDNYHANPGPSSSTSTHNPPSLQPHDFIAEYRRYMEHSQIPKTD